MENRSEFGETQTGQSRANPQIASALWGRCRDLSERLLAKARMMRQSTPRGNMRQSDPSLHFRQLGTGVTIP